MIDWCKQQRMIWIQRQHTSHIQVEQSEWSRLEPSTPGFGLHVVFAYSVFAPRRTAEDWKHMQQGPPPDSLKPRGENMQLDNQLFVLRYLFL